MEDSKMNSRPLYAGPGAVIEGDVRFGRDVSVWHNAVIRTESEPVIIEDGSNVQDGCIIHTDPGFPVRIGRNVTIGHGAIVHGAHIEDDCLIGMGAIVMNGAVIRKGSIIAAGALISEGRQIEPDSLMAGVPARLLRQTGESDRQSIEENAAHYVLAARAHSDRD